MDSEDFIELPTVNKSGYVSEGDGSRVSGGVASSLPLNSEGENEINGEASQAMLHDICEEAVETKCVPVSTESFNENKKDHMPTDIEKDVINKTPTDPVDFKMAESVAIVNTLTSNCSVNTDNGSVPVESEGISSNHKKTETRPYIQGIDGGSVSGVKRPRMTVDELQPSVHVSYNSLTRESKRKLEELLQQWSQWHGQNCSSSNDSNTVIESGEETYFPALHVGLDKPSQVTYWVDNQTFIQSNKEFIPLEGVSVPLYDREYSLAWTSDDSNNLNGGAEKLDASRCFNCGSYSHALKDCSKPRDNVAVNSARKKHSSQRNRNAISRNSIRYYQSSRGGKYDGLTPGVLDPETRKLLSLGELDPPPWLNRMRELGYPPGYLDADEEEDRPSGITIFGDEPSKEKCKEDEIHIASSSNPTRKKSVKFPGINAPIPGKANALLWAASTSTTLPINHSPREYNNHLHLNFSQVNHQKPMFLANLNDERPPGCDLLTSSSLTNPRLTPLSLPYSLASPPAWSPNLGRSMSDRGWRSPVAQDSDIVYPSYGRYGAYPYPSPR